MRYYLPDVRVPEDLPPQTQAEDKLGGLPWGLPQRLWPVCAQCAQPQALVAQLLHHPQRLDLGREGRVLFVFHCIDPDATCEAWEGGSGANACFVVEPEELSAGPSATPDAGLELIPEVRIAGWVEREDGITEEEVKTFYGSNEFTLPETIGQKIDPHSRLGSVPAFRQSFDEHPGAGWRFVGQLAGDYYFLQKPKRMRDDIQPADPDEWGPTVKYIGTGANFGGGTAYLFLRDTAGRPEGWFFSQG